jgi:hypothetical protein
MTEWQEIHYSLLYGGAYLLTRPSSALALTTNTKRKVYTPVVSRSWIVGARLVWEASA